MFDLTFSLGNALTILSFLVGGIYFVSQMKSDGKLTERRLEMIDSQFEDVKVELKKLAEIMVTLAQTNGRIDRVEDRQLAEGKRIDEFILRFNQHMRERGA
jgi:3-methyladenine DNA glycosylase AlkD